MQNLDSDLYRQTLERTKYAPDLCDILHIFWRKTIIIQRKIINKPKLAVSKGAFFL